METNLITIKPYDSVYVKVECERSIAKELSEFFTFKVPNYQYTPAYKNKVWDGQIRLYNVHTQTFYRGLISYLADFANERNYNLKNNVEMVSHSISDDSLRKYITEHLKVPFEPYDHQVEAIKHALEEQRTLLVSPTGSGKSLIIYTLMRYYLDQLPPDKKILIIVPTTSLVSQMMSDFSDYAENSDWNVEDNCHYIMSGQEKTTDKKIVISTWQSIHRENEKFFRDFHCVFGDECHLFKAKSLTGIMTKLKSCDYRVGTTGTLDGTQTHKLVIEGLFGLVKKVTTTKKLMDKDLLSRLKIDCLVLSYDNESVKQTKKAKYIDEIKWIINNEKRNEFIANLSCKLKGNTLLLFNYVKEHGFPLHDLVKEHCPDKDIYFIHGGTDVKQREEIRKHIDNVNRDSVLIASYGTCSTGINIKNINNIIFASPSRSVIRVLQSIGRGLRKSNTKDKVRLFDISDDLRYMKYVNHTYRHMQERTKIYNNERFDHTHKNLKLEG
jgi:superfamily II DNA or RNA helicase